MTVIDGKVIADALLHIWADYKHKVIMPQIEKESERQLKKMAREKAVREKELAAEIKNIMKDIKDPPPVKMVQLEDFKIGPDGMINGPFKVLKPKK